jgi:hypothetical protein
MPDRMFAPGSLFGVDISNETVPCRIFNKHSLLTMKEHRETFLEAWNEFFSPNP